MKYFSAKLQIYDGIAYVSNNGKEVEVKKKKGKKLLFIINMDNSKTLFNNIDVEDSHNTASEQAEYP